MQLAAADALRFSSGRLRAIAGLTGPAYFWLALTVFLPLSAMLYFSFLSDVPFGKRVAVLTLENYAAFFEKEFYRTLMLRSFRLGAEVTFYCFLFGFPCAGRNTAPAANEPHSHIPWGRRLIRRCSGQ